MAAAAARRLGKCNFERKPCLVLRRTPMGAVLRRRRRWGRAMSGPPTTPLVSMTAECLGHVLARGKAGYEAFDRDERSLGTFKTQHEAAAALEPQP